MAMAQLLGQRVEADAAPLGGGAALGSVASSEQSGAILGWMGHAFSRMAVHN